LKTIYFIRHGESEANKAGVCGGVLDSALTIKGIDQAKKAGKLINKKGINFDVILSSPLQRAHFTAKLIAQYSNHDPKLIELVDDLRERNFGKLEGKNLVKTTKISGEFYLANPRSIDHIKGVEKLADIHQRAERFLDFIKQRPEQTILLVSHGAFARSLMKAVKGIPYDAPIDPIDNAKIIKLI
jgi:broad specificity phosphatase PhoE